MILELDPEITDDNIKYFMTNCRGNNCMENFEIVQDLENNFEVDYSRLNIGECECSNVLEFIINRRDISKIIDQDNLRNSTDRIIFKKRYDLLWEEKHPHTGSKTRIKEQEKCIDILLEKGFSDVESSSVIRYYNNLHNSYKYGPYID